ncbi:HAD family phosphatase [Actinosynnema sp. NPDC047251]|uniref:HAD-superfamily hydrolase, subfamily IA, variant 3 n=1 Tax=Saccharothrix espanaensis (strain ATCC 51144 / DSM 44229 / JCM 9112 / NBRC 15066 / NRRL 15764) TaxID=1179773 RepID=K0JZN3_SACES|nr:HAD family phosphatase [Saccharothrix espanaensis]CCH31541.1 HAD-superfamily hydrolase, subfamily IA, variant 3 [Saccharothrix espanaensis DSM 44229]
MADPERPIDAVVLDWGGVLTVSVPTFIEDWLHREDIDRERYGTTIRAWMGRDAAPDNPVSRLETGHLPVAEFERLLAAELRTPGGAAIPAHGLLRRMFGAAQTDPAMVDLVRDLRARGLRTVLLSNSWGEGYPEELLLELFDTVVISGRVGLRKPDPKIFAHTLEVIGLPAHRCAFVDDAPANVDAARAVGLHAHRHTDAESTRAVLAALLGAAA